MQKTALAVACVPALALWPACDSSPIVSAIGTFAKVAFMTPGPLRHRWLDN